MIFGQDREELRKMYADAWQKRCDSLPMSPLEVQIADVIALHPEYPNAVTPPDPDQEYTPNGGSKAIDQRQQEVTVAVVERWQSHEFAVERGR